MPLIIVAAASGQHAAVVYESAILSAMPVRGFVTVDGNMPSSLLDCRWLGHLEEVAIAEIARGAHFSVACGSNALRRKLSEALLEKGASLASIRHPSAIISPSASIAAGAVLFAGAIAGTKASIGRGAIVNHGASIGHDCRVGDYANISPGARLGGSVHLGAGAMVGPNASIIQGLRVGEDAVVGAGAVVTRDVEPATTVVGVPARRLLT
jgi:acetyltransferase EpsM